MEIKNIVDIILIVFILINMFLGWKKGLVLSIFNFFGIVGAFIIAKKYFIQFSNILLNNVNWVSEFKNNITLKINNSFNSNTEVVNNINNGTILNKLDLPEYLNSGMNQLLKGLDIMKLDNANTKIADIIVNVMINFLSFVLLFILLVIIIKIIGITLNMIFKLPILKGINQLGGFIMGFVISNILIFAFMALIILLNPMNLDFGLKEIINQSRLGAFYYNNNLLFVLLNYYL